MEHDHNHDHDLPPLPPLPRVRPRSPSRTVFTSQSTNTITPTATTAPFAFQKPYRANSRRLDDLSSLPSSDPAFFSSDDLPASGLENYNTTSSNTASRAGSRGGGGSVSSTGRTSRKRRYRGTWWGDETTTVDPKRKRADFKDKRNVDSGVWMGSDESSLLPSEDASVWGAEDDLLKSSTTVELPACQAEQNAVDVVGMRDWDLRRIQEQAQVRSVLFHHGRTTEESTEHRTARAIVNACLEKGQDSVDLSNGLLRTIHPGLLRPLQHLTKLPSIREAPVTEDGYASLEPFLRVFLSGNALTTISGELFELDLLKVLSLRNNKLTDIPTAIRRMTLLQEVNLSVNRLQYLPWELLWLIRKGDLKHLIVRPNPFLQIEAAEIATWHHHASSDEPHASVQNPLPQLRSCDYEGPAPEEAWAPIHVADSPIRRFNMDGLPVDDDRTQSPGSSSSTNQNTTPTHQSRVPSLRELSLLALSQSPHLDQLLDSAGFMDTDADIESDSSPPFYFLELITRLVRQAQEVRRTGGRSCSVCHRVFIIPRTEWIEWWDCTTYENGLKGPRGPGEVLRPLPFRRLGCSWACVPGDGSIH